MSMSDRIFGSYTTLNKKRVMDVVNEVNSLAKKYASFSDAELSEMTDVFRREVREGKNIDDIKPDALAVCREAIKRRLNMWPYDVQIEAAAAMDQNVIAEMKTGEGKTLVQILSSYLYAIGATQWLDKSDWSSVHIITSNDYLAKRDKEDNAPVFELLGLTCGYAEDRGMLSVNPNYKREKKAAYNCDIVYGTAKTIIFDYLGDNHAKNKDARYINKPLYHAIIDEADDILLDQATTPLVLSGKMPGDSKEKRNEVYRLQQWAENFVNGTDNDRGRPLVVAVAEQYRKAKDEYEGDCVLFLDDMSIQYSEELIKEIYGPSESLNEMGIRPELVSKEFAINNAILATYYFKNGVDYILERDKDFYNSKGELCKVYSVALLGETTGRTMKNTRYRNGIQEAIEARESAIASKKDYYIKLSAPTVNLARCTYPNFIGLYETGISGMTGTSDIKEMDEIYLLQTYEVPCKKKNIRVDEEDAIYATKKAKYKAILREVLECQETLQPVLIGTTSIIESDDICKYLDSYGIRYQRLDAVNKENEDCVKETAGLLGMVTVATNMAGRGIDIKLGPGSNEAGGLYVIGTSKNHNVRIDNQLRGRAARQGEPGRTKYFQSLEDEMVMVRYGSLKLMFYKKFYENSEEEIKNKKVKSIVDKCQTLEESLAKETRKYSEELDAQVYTDHMNKIYSQRREIVDADNKKFENIISNMIESYVKELVKDEKEVDIKLGHLIDVPSCYEPKKKDYQEKLTKKLLERFKNAEGMSDRDEYLKVLKDRVLDLIDIYWISHMEALDELKDEASHAAYSNIDPVEKYTKDTTLLLHSMTPYLQNEIITYALSPNTPFGTYVVKEIENEREKGKILC